MHKHHSCGSEKGCCSESSQGCGCGCSSCGCSSCGCSSSQGSSCQSGSCHSSQSCHEQGSCHSHHDDCGSHEEHLLCLVKSIKHELLEEKIAEQLEAKLGKKLDEAATVLVDAFIAQMEQKIHAKETCCSFRDKLRAIFKG